MIKRKLLFKLIIPLLLILGQNSALGVEMPRIKNGVLDISKWDFKKRGPIKISGKVPFYWNKLLDPQDIIEKGPPVKDYEFDITTLWTSQKVNAPIEKFERGYGSYLFKVIGSKVREEDLAFEIFAFSTAYSLYKIEGDKVEKIISDGVVGKSFEKSIPTFKKTLNYYKFEKSEYYILIHASNYHYRSGGVFYPILMGEYKSILKENKKNIKKDLLILGILFIMAIYHFGLFSLRRADYGSLWFGLFCFNMFIRLGVTPHSYLLADLEDSTFLFYLNSKLEYLTLCTGPVLFLGFLKSIFGNYFALRWIKFAGIFALVFSSVVLFTSPFIFTRNFVTINFNLLILFTIIYCMAKLVKAFFNKVPYAKVCLLGCLIYFTGLLFDMFVLYKVPELPFIAPITFVAFIFIQSYILATKFSIAYKTAERLSKDLTKEVAIQTKEAVEQKNRAIESEKEVSDLLHNMSQAVFTIDSTFKVAPPVSEYAKIIFNRDIVGTDIFNNIYKDIDKKSEEYGVINTVFSTIFDAEELQWLIMKDHLPTKISLKLNDEKDPKILKIAYTPLYNEENLFFKLMFIIEDITEVERLEKEMQAQKEQVSKKGQIIQELASSKKEELQSFFQSNHKLSKEAIDIWKKARNNRAVKKEIENLNIFYRNLHTIKGNARIYGLSLISKLAHDTESKIEDFKNEGINALSSEDFDEGLQFLYELNGQINSYLMTAKEIFNIESEDDTEFKLELHELIKEVEFWLGQVLIFGSQNGNFNIIEKIGELEEDIKEQILSSLKRYLHSVKSLTRSMDHKELSGKIHLLEGTIFEAAIHEGIDENNYEELWQEPLKETMSYSRKLFFESSHFKPINLRQENWTNLFDDFFKIVKFKDDPAKKEEVGKLLFSLNSKSKTYNLNFIPLTIRSVYEAITENDERKDAIVKLHLGRVWKFFKLLIQFDLEKYIPLKLQQDLIEHINRYDKTEKWEIELSNLINSIENYGEPLVVSFFKSSMNYLESQKDFIKLIRSMEVNKSFGLEDLISKNQGNFSIEECFAVLKESYSAHVLEGLNVKENSAFENLIELVNTKESFVFGYTESIDIMGILKNYIELEDDRDDHAKPEVIEVLKENFLYFKTTLKESIGKEGTPLWTNAEGLLNELTNHPVKYSLKNLKNMANEISKGLGKKIKLTLKGEQGSLNQTKLNLLKDAAVHLVRNSIDHGIELPELRIMRGKSEFGLIEVKLSYNELNKLIVEIKDDGNGVNANLIAEKAFEKGIISKNELDEMDLAEKINLIFLPNLSTKKDVTELSGRGVGMDVVKSNIESIGAELKVVTVPGEGTQFFITFVS